MGNPALLEGTSIETQAARKAFIEQQFSTEATFAMFLPDTTEAKEKLVDSLALASKQDRFEYILKPLLMYLIKTTSQSLVKQKLGEVLKLEASVVERLLTSSIKLPLHPTTIAALDVFLASTFVTSDKNTSLTAILFKDQFDAFTLLRKIATIITRFKITPKQMVWIFDHSVEAGWLDLTALPLAEISPSPTLLDSWLKLVDLFRLRDTLPQGEKVLATMFSLARDPVATEDALLKKLSELLGWNLDDLTFMTDSQRLAFSFPNVYKDEQALVRLKACFDMLKRLGMSAEQTWVWAIPDAPSNFGAALQILHSIKNAVKSKYEEKQWLKVAKPLKDVLRERQRQALVAYLVSHPLSARGQRWRDIHGLYEHFLIDVEMSPCQMISRTKQAISSVQLFVQRCLMNLEPEVALTAENARRWMWIRNYRVWEANRKIFLYPENWIEPTLREDKSPFFKDLENELLQNDVTMDTAENAFLHYLEKLDEVAHLEACGMYHQFEQDTQGRFIVDILHVFARTKGIPHLYYYRQRVNAAHWTAWEKIDVDIQSDHLIPVVWNRRLHLFWPIITEKGEAGKDDSPTAKPTISWQIQLAWSEYNNGKWTVKKVSPENASLNDLFSSSEEKPDKSSLSFDSTIQGEVLTLHCYRYKQVSDKQVPAAKTAIMRIANTPEVEKAGMGIVSGYVFEGVNDNQTQDDEQGIGNVTVKLNSSRASYTTKTDPDGSYTFSDLLANSYTIKVFPPTGYVSTIVSTRQITLGNTVSRRTATVNFGIKNSNQGNGTPGSSQGREDSATKKELVVVGSFSFQECHGEIVQSIADRGKQVSYPGKSHPENMTFVVDNTSFSSDSLYVTQYSQGESILKKMNGRTRILYPHQFYGLSPEQAPLYLDVSNGSSDFVVEKPFIYQDDSRTFFLVGRDLFKLVVGSGSAWDEKPFSNIYLRRQSKQFTFQNFYHPYVRLFIRALKRHGIDGLLDPQPDGVVPQLRRQYLSKTFFYDYLPEAVAEPYPVDTIDFEGGPYSLYNWELFFHAPFLIACKLSQNQRFEEAQKWFHYIFDPAATDAPDNSNDPGPERFWKVKPFYDNTKNGKIQTIEEFIQDAEQLKKQVAIWHDQPFKPHVIAGLRPVAYQKAVVMKYIDNLIAWGDNLFRRDTLEALNEATHLYVLAAEILGKRPEDIPARAKPKIMTYKAIEPAPDDDFNILAPIENFLSPSIAPSTGTGNSGSVELQMSYFCIPGNDELRGYWDTVADRLFKIRHCMNIEGVVQQLPLFESPINPALLVRAAATGVDISSTLSDINGSQPYYRFSVMLQKATELCNDVKVLGGALLSALEKQDAEALSILRSSHEIMLLNAMQQVKEQQINEAREALAGLEKMQEMVSIREVYYKNIAFMSDWEAIGLSLMGGALLSQAISMLLDIAATGGHQIPSVTVGISGMASPVLTVTYGGDNVGHSLTSAAEVMRGITGILNAGASMSSTLGGYWRRMDEWQLQERLASKEGEQLEKQIAAAKIRYAIAEKELANHKLQVANAGEVDAYMREKFTNQELYSWMSGQVAIMYFQSYQMAYDVARRAERAYRFERGLTDSSFIQFGYWDSLKKGLLAGEKLHYDLKRMDLAYIEQNKREYEITKHISLVLHNPMALIALKETGTCFMSLPEALFDMDYPGHYMRRVKSVSLTIPCVTGPYTSINCTLTLLKNTIRMNSDLADGSDPYSGPKNVDDKRFSSTFGAIESIATSTAQNDSGMFEVNFRDERYLRFEGVGAISEWRIDMPKDTNAFNFETVSDVIIRLNYTAREGGTPLRDAARKATQFPWPSSQTTDTDKPVEFPAPQHLLRLFSAKHEFASEWYRFLHPADTKQTLSIGLTMERFPFQLRGKVLQIDAMHLFLKLKEGLTYKDNQPFAYNDDKPLAFILKREDGTELPPSNFKSKGSPIAGLPYAEPLNPQSDTEPLNAQGEKPGQWSLEVKEDDVKKVNALLQQVVTINGQEHVRLNPDAIEDVWIVCQYQVVARGKVQE